MGDPTLSDIYPCYNRPYHFRFVLSKGPTVASLGLTRCARTRTRVGISLTYYIDSAAKEAKVGDRLDVCPEGLAMGEEIATRLKEVTCTLVAM